MELIKERCKLADRQARIDQKNEFIIRRDARRKGSKHANAIYQMFPPRREWCSIGKRRQRLDSVKRNELKLKCTYWKAKRRKSKAEWFARLCIYADSIVEMVSTKSACLDPPKVSVIEKKKDYKEKTVICRPICSFPLETKIVFSIINRYLTQEFDSFFYDCSFAFRANVGKYSLQHINAVDAIKQYRIRHSSMSLYVAECDMKKFYDTISHNIIKTRFSILLHRCIKEGRISVKEAKVIKKWVFMYVDCFNFREHVFIHNKKKADDSFWERVQTYKIWPRRIEWVDELGIIKKNAMKDVAASDFAKYKKDQAERRKNRHRKVGIPQGGPLSGLIANIVMHSVDKAVKNAIGNDDILYCRFCDDMVLVGTDNERISMVFQSYQQAVRKSMLYAHPNKMCVKKAKDFWDGKTRGPYEWNEKGEETYPWITFVGFDINWKGNLRVRKASLDRQIKKQYDTAYELLQPYRRGEMPRFCANTIRASLESRLICMSVGRVKMWNYKNFGNNCSWMSAFPILDKNPWSEAQMKNLDKHRYAVIKKASEELKKYDCPKKKKKDDNSVDGENSRFIFRGGPYSYYGQCFIYKKD